MKFRIFTGVIVTTILAAPVQLAGEQQSSPLLADESRVSRRHVEWSQ